MNRELAEKVANAVLYEGYMLYPYRPSAIKNRQRWTFGILYPPAYQEVRGGTERAGMHIECLLEAQSDPSIHVQLRFLHLMARQVDQFCDGKFEPVSSLTMNDQLIESWDEGVERSVDFKLPACSSAQPVRFSFAGSCETESLQDAHGQIVGGVSRTQHEITGIVSASSEKIRDGVLKLSLDVTNTTHLPSEASDRNAALLRALLSAHVVLTAQCGAFISLLDPPADLREAVSALRNVGNFPVLIGNQNERDMLLCSPIVFYDYPQIAPESAGDFYDATEMDEMLTLRVMTLTDQEKTEMRLADSRVHNLLERTEQSAREQLMRTHGTIRSPVEREP